MLLDVLAVWVFVAYLGLTQLFSLEHHYAVSEDSLILKNEVMDGNTNPVFLIMNKAASP